MDYIAEAAAEALVSDLVNTVEKLNACTSKEEEDRVIAEMQSNAREVGRRLGEAYAEAMIRSVRELVQEV